MKRATLGKCRSLSLPVERLMEGWLSAWMGHGDETKRTATL